MTVISSLVPIVLSLCDVIARVKMMIIAMRRNKEQSRHTHVHALITRGSFLNSRFFTQDACSVVKNYAARRKKIDTSPTDFSCPSLDVRQFGVSVCTENNAVLCRAVADFFTPSFAWFTKRIFATLHALSRQQSKFLVKILLQIKG